MSIPHQTLDFFPNQYSQIHTLTKTRTFCLGDGSTKYNVGEQILLTEFGIPLVQVIIKRVQVKRAVDFTKADLKGTEFKNLHKACDSLRSVYRLPFIEPQTVFSIIDWKYLEES